MPKIKNVPFEFKNELKDGKHILTLSGTIRQRYWDDDKSIDAKLVSDSLDGVTDDIVIYLNSTGGDVFQGIEIYNYLKNHSSHITVEVTGTAASAATFIVAGADEAIMNTGTSFMIHEASSFAWGNKADLKKTLNALETIDESIIAIYTEKTGQSNEQLNDWMEEEKWFTAEEAVKYGFANKVKENKKDITDQIDIAAMINQSVAQAMEQFSAQATSKKHSIEKLNELKNEKPKQKSLLNKLRKGEQ
ncbi:hypothetical protein CAT7_04934 [Carnobacterium sp. AT7]|uniref:head maturation protease, ClpP-related n=1 Tax=Carnobacterium sp. AT7 TaxID=333990 RepID=UPI00015F19C2|nr:head maturation protease, ClpP-related [Carnobacterium sp. AT7]EDP68583.1 hypothetical protein CAT7_04934 [Carnobacterium sp. AT7]